MFRAVIFEFSILHPPDKRSIRSIRSSIRSIRSIRSSSSSSIKPHHHRHHHQQNSSGTCTASGVTLSSRSEGSNTAASSNEYSSSPSVVQAAHSRPVGLNLTQVDRASSRVFREDPSAPSSAPWKRNNAGRNFVAR